MAILDDIAAAFRSPRAEMDHQMSIMTEPRIMMLGLTACCLSFVSELPAIAANVSIAGESIDVLNGRAGALFITRVFFGVLLLYSVAALSHILLIPLKGQGNWQTARLSVCWGAMVATPLVLMCGILKVFVSHPIVLICYNLTTIIFLWQFLACLWRSEFPRISKTE